MQIRPEQSSFLKKYRWMTVFIVLCFAVLLGRLVQMQLFQGRDYRDQAHNLMIRRITLKAKRGVIMDRRGRVMVDNEINFNVYIVPRYFPEEAFGKLKKYLKLDDEQSRHIQKKILGAQGDRRAFSLLAAPAITWDQRARLETNAFELPGVRVLTEWKRRYPYGNLAAHALGYVNEVSRAEIRRLGGYRIGDKIGRFGIERQWEYYLRGKPGFERFIVDARSRRQKDKRLLRLLGPPAKRRQRPQTGSNLVLTLDLDLQRIVESSLRWHPAGAAVVVEVNTGRILAMSSKPAFDPAMLSSRLSREQARQLYDNPYHPMLDKTVMGSYFPGSTFKVITAIAALEERLANTYEYIFCKGYHEYGRKSAFRCTSQHGAMHFHSAIVRSCNIYFYTLGQRVGMNRLSRYARDFGLGTPTGLGLNGERGGFIPTKAWYAKNMPGGFRIGHTLNASVGQGNVTTTPLQLAMAYATIANGGKLYLPQIVQRLETSTGKTLRTFPPVLRRRVQVSDRTLRLIKAGLTGVVNEPGGTANDAWDGRLSAAGKTGTAQVIKREKKSRDPRDWWRFEDHAWFAAYAPTENPEIAVVVLIEHGGSAGKVAAPIALRIIRDYFAKVRPKVQPPISPETRPMIFPSQPMGHPMGRMRFQLDWTIFLLIGAISGVGLLNLYSASGGGLAGRFLQQIYWFILGTSAFLVVATIDYRQYNHYGYWIYAGGLILLLLTLVVGRRVKGSTRWIGYGPLGVQPSELIKIVVIVVLAKYLHSDPRVEGRGLKDLAGPFALVAAPVALILAQPDLGTALLIILIFFSLMLMSKLKLRSFLVLMSSLVVIAPLTWTLMLKDYQKRRFLSFLDPEADPTGAGYHLKQSLIAIGSGELTGKGFQQGTQSHLRFLPETWTDFPFAVWAEEWGFIGSVVLLGLYLFLIVWGVNLARTARDRFASVVCIGVAVMFFWHVMINIGMVSGLLPIVGVTLPLFSYGGSSVLTFMIGAGLLMNVSIRRYSY